MIMKYDPRYRGCNKMEKSKAKRCNEMKNLKRGNHKQDLNTMQDVKNKCKKMTIKTPTRYKKRQNLHNI